MFGFDDESCSEADDYNDNKRNDAADEGRVQITAGVTHRFRVVKGDKVMWRTNSADDALRVKRLLERPPYRHEGGEVYNSMFIQPMTDDEISHALEVHRYTDEEEDHANLLQAKRERDAYRKGL